jgi:hypothetical protein
MGTAGSRCDGHWLNEASVNWRESYALLIAGTSKLATSATHGGCSAPSTS